MFSGIIYKDVSGNICQKTICFRKNLPKYKGNYPETTYFENSFRIFIEKCWRIFFVFFMSSRFLRFFLETSQKNLQRNVRENKRKYSKDSSETSEKNSKTGKFLGDIPLSGKTGQIIKYVSGKFIHVIQNAFWMFSTKTFKKFFYTRFLWRDFMEKDSKHLCRNFPSTIDI